VGDNYAVRSLKLEDWEQKPMDIQKKKGYIPPAIPSQVGSDLRLVSNLGYKFVSRRSCSAFRMNEAL
jgi:hypothetical protein